MYIKAIQSIKICKCIALLDDHWFPIPVILNLSQRYGAFYHQYPGSDDGETPTLYNARFVTFNVELQPMYFNPAVFFKQKVQSDNRYFDLNKIIATSLVCCCNAGICS